MLWTTSQSSWILVSILNIRLYEVAHLLDYKGASSSWVPYGVISQLRSIFSSDVNRELEAQHSGEYSGTPVIGSAHLHLSGEIADQISANKWKMFYEFEGTNGKRIKIRGPPSPFICDASSDSGKNKPADGLLFALPDSSQPGSENSGLAIFGLVGLNVQHATS